MASFRALVMKNGFHSQLANGDVLLTGSGADANVVQAWTLGAVNASSILVSRVGGPPLNIVSGGVTDGVHSTTVSQITFRSVANTTALAAIDVGTLANGTVAYVETQRSFYNLRNGAFFRTVTPSVSWQSEPAWFVSDAGTVDGVGTNAGDPITQAELRARLYQGQRAPINIAVTITVLGTAAAEGLIFHATMGPVGDLVLQGTLTTVTSTAFTSFAGRASATNLPNRGTTAADVWTANVGKMVVDTQAGANFGAAAWINKLHVVNTGRLSSFLKFDNTSFIIAPTEITPGVTDTFNIVTQTVITGPVDIDIDGCFVVASGFGKATIRDFNLAPSAGFGTGILVIRGPLGYLVNCAMSAGLEIATSGFDGYINCLFGQAGSFGAWYPSASENEESPQNVYGGSNLGNFIFLDDTGTVFFRNGTLVQTGNMTIAGRANLTIQNMGFFDWSSSAILAKEGGYSTVFAVAGLWGTSAVAGSFPIAASSGSQFMNQSGTWVSTFPITGALATLSLDGSTTAMPVDAVTWLDLPPAQTLSFANLDLATGAAGFGGKAVNKRGHGTFNRTGVA